MFERKGEIMFPAEIGDEDTVMMAAIGLEPRMLKAQRMGISSGVLIQI